jgi:hypothetical protein
MHGRRWRIGLGGCVLLGLLIACPAANAFNSEIDLGHGTTGVASALGHLWSADTHTVYEYNDRGDVIRTYTAGSSTTFVSIAGDGTTLFALEQNGPTSCTIVNLTSATPATQPAGCGLFLAMSGANAENVVPDGNGFDLQGFDPSLNSANTGAYAPVSSVTPLGGSCFTNLCRILMNDGGFGIFGAVPFGGGSTTIFPFTAPLPAAEATNLAGESVVFSEVTSPILGVAATQVAANGNVTSGAHILLAGSALESITAAPLGTASYAVTAVMQGSAGLTAWGLKYDASNDTWSSLPLFDHVLPSGATLTALTSTPDGLGVFTAGSYLLPGSVSRSQIWRSVNGTDLSLRSVRFGVYGAGQRPANLLGGGPYMPIAGFQPVPVTARVLANEVLSAQADIDNDGDGIVDAADLEMLNRPFTRPDRVEHGSFPLAPGDDMIADFSTSVPPAGFPASTSSLGSDTDTSNNARPQPAVHVEVPPVTRAFWAPKPFDISVIAQVNVRFHARTGLAASQLDIAVMRKRGSDCTWLTGHRGKFADDPTCEHPRWLALTGTGHKRSYRVRHMPHGKVALLVRRHAGDPFGALEFGKKLGNLFLLKIK